MTNDSTSQPSPDEGFETPEIPLIQTPDASQQDKLDSEKPFPSKSKDSASQDFPKSKKGSRKKSGEKVPRRFDKRPTKSEEVDSQLVDQTKTQIRLLVQEIADLAKSDCSVEDFYEGFLTRTTSALASVGGAIWVRDSIDDPLKLHYHINLKKTKLAKDKKAQARHSRMLKKLAEQGEPTLVSPDSGSADDDLAGNPTDSLLIVGPLKIDNDTIGLVEIFQRPGAGPTTQRGYLRFLMQMCDIASDFLRNQRIRSFAKQQTMWQQLEQFMRLIHQGLDTEQTVFTLANEGRRLIDCDRVSVAMGQGRNCRIKAVSGLDSIERRAEQVKKLGRLSASVIKAGQPLWYTGEDENLPPQIEKKMHAYVDKSHTKMLAIIPLFESQGEPDDTPEARKNRTPAKPLGALIIEQLKDARITPALEKRAEIVVEHGQTALTNSTEHNSIFLMPLWKGIGKVTNLFGVGNRFKTFCVLGAIAGALAFLCLFPYPFGLSAKGALIPETQREVFAQTDGTVIDINVSDAGDSLVDAGSTLAQLKNTEIGLEISRLVGNITEQDAIFREAERTLSRDGINGESLDNTARLEVNSRMRQASAAKENLTAELIIRQQEQEFLTIVSPIAGQVVSWNVRSNLLNRPVKRGQSLMTVVPPDTMWQIELEMPERRLAHLLRAMDDKDEPLKVTFGLFSNPGKEYEGQILRIDRKLEVYSDDGNSALIRVAFPNDSIDPELLRAETRVNAKVQCGTRSIGYVMFHELIETVQSSFMFWF